MQIGEKRVVTLPPDQAYGERDEGLVGEVPRDKLPNGVTFEPGASFTMDTGNGEAQVKVVSVQGEMVTIDANHPLAGETLTFEIELVAFAG
jgi:FKBP-type peptidyl-prolyl cis-trans isomerase 2